MSQMTATKGNLMSTKKTLSLSSMGFELLDKKRNILIREMMQLLDKSKLLRNQIGETYEKAYKALQKANMTLGVIEDFVKAVPIDEGVNIRFRSVMGVDIPIVEYTEKQLTIPYGFFHTNSQLDYVYQCFHEVKQMTILMAEVENSIYRLGNAIVKTQRRANALKNVVIPQLRTTVKFITDSLEEKEREEFSRLKVIKKSKAKEAAQRENA